MAVLGGLGIVLGFTGFARHEALRPAIGAYAIAFQSFAWMVLVIAFVVIVSVIFQDFGDIFGSQFGG